MLTHSKFTEELVFNALQILKENGGHIQVKDLHRELGKRTEFNEWASHTNRKGVPRWHVILGFRTVPAVKSGYLIKKRGRWSLTDKGRDVLEFGAHELAKRSKEKYEEWAKDNNPLVIEERKSYRKKKQR